MSAHTPTPTPWVSSFNEKCAYVEILGKRGDGDVRTLDGLGTLVIVECAADPDAVMFSPVNAEQVANAELIVRAVNSHEALIKASQEVEDAISDGLCNEGIPGFDRYRLERARIALREVIDQARGEAL